MKKIISLFLIVIMILSLSACGEKDSVKNDILGDLDFSHTSKPDNTKENESVNTDDAESSQQEIKSDLKMSKEYNGLYTIGNFMSFSFGQQKQITLDIKGVDVENSGTIDASQYNLPDCLSNIKEYVYLDIKFNNNKMSIDIVTRDTKESLNGMNDNEAVTKIFSEFQGELKSVGNIPTEDIYMSNYQPGNVYVFDIPENKLKDYEIPNSINDTEHDVVLYTIKNNEGEMNDRVFVFQNSFNSDNRQFVLLPDSTDGKIYMGVAVATPEMVAKDNKLIKLSNYEVNDKINIGVNEIIHNNTEKTITINVKAGEDTKVMKIKPNCMADVSFIYDVTILNIE
jgi:predicted small lipoprotein YifL